MKIEEQLKDLGFHPSEIAVYLYLLEHGISDITQISQATGIARTNCYRVLDHLLEKDLIERQTQKSKTKYLANNPVAILRMVEKKREMVTEGLLPDLTGLYKSAGNKPIIKFYEGTEQIKEIFIQMYDADEEILGLTSIKKLFPLFPGFFEKWRAELKKRKIFLRDILTEESKPLAQDVSVKELDVFFDHRVIPQKFGDLDADILVWNDNVALLSLEEPIIGTVITNQYIADTVRIMHKVMWSALRR